MTELRKHYILDESGNVVGVQYPLSTDGDSTYPKDVWTAQSDLGDFTDSGNDDITDLFTNAYTDFVDNTANNPKSISVRFNRIVFASVIGLGAKDGTFSNVKILAKDAAGTTRTTVDDSANNTAYTSMKYPLSDSEGFIEVEIQFHTVNQINLNAIIIPKIIRTISRLQAIKPDGTETEINATAGGNLKVSVEELNEAVTVDDTTGALVTIDYGHHEIHDENHYFIKNWTDIAGSTTVDFLVVTPNTTAWGHMLLSFSFEAEANIIVYEGTTVSLNGAAVSSYNRNRNSSNTAGILVYTGPTVTTVGTQIAAYKAGSGKAIGGEVRANAEIILKQNTNYLIRITNDTVSNNWMDYLADWYEHISL